MRFDIHHYHHTELGSEVRSRLDAINRKLDCILERQEKIMATLADITAAVARERTVEDSVLALLQGISQQLKDAIASNDPAAMQAIVDQIDANAATMSDAVNANTSATPAP